MKTKTFGKILLTGLLAGTFFASPLLADYNKGYKYYEKYIKRASHLKGTDFLKVIGIKTPDDVENLLKDNAQPLIKNLTEIEKFYDMKVSAKDNIDTKILEEIKRLKEMGITKEQIQKTIKAIKKIVKKHKIKDLKDFLTGLTNGKIPAG